MTGDELGANVAAHFGALPDPGRDINRERLLMDILVNPICAIVWGGGGLLHVVLFGEAKTAG